MTKYHRELAIKQGSGEFANNNEDSNLMKLQAERKQLLEWGENLYKEVSKLEREKRKLETDVSQERDSVKQLEHSNEQLLSKCVHLESILQGNSPKKDYDLDTVTDHEHAELRKKIAQYAVEIDNLRKENEAALEALNSAQAVAQQRVLERDSYFLTVEELEQSFQKLQEKSAQMEAQLDTENATKKQMEDRLHEAQLELDVMCASLKLARREAETHVLTLEGVEKHVKDKNELMLNLTDMIEPLRSCFVKMQQAFAQQTKEYSAFVEEVHNRQREAGMSLEVAKEEISILETVTDHLRNELGRMKEEFSSNHQELEAQLAAEREGRTQQQQELELVRDEWERERTTAEALITSKKQQLTALRGTIKRMQQKDKPKSAKDCNFSKEVQEARKGVELMKISEKEGSSTKLIYIDPDDLTLVYKRSWPRRGTQQIDLAEIIHFGWGRSCRAYVVGQKKQMLLKPWLCFSLYSKNRSFDFIVPESRDEERDLQIMLLALSAMCPNCSGLIPTRRKFSLRKALMKIDEQCKWKQVTRAQLIYAALERKALEDGITLPKRKGEKDKTDDKPKDKSKKSVGK